VEKLHPGHGRELEKPIYIPWAHVKWNEGSWIDTYGKGPQAPGVAAKPGGPDAAPPQTTNANYEALLQPDGPFYFAGDHCSHLVAWQEGAALSAKRAVGMITQRLGS
jgi:monoamine oxidase